MRLKLEVKGTTNIALATDIKINNLKFSHLLALEPKDSLSDKVFDIEYLHACDEYNPETIEVTITEINLLECESSKRIAK